MSEPSAVFKLTNLLLYITGTQQYKFAYIQGHFVHTELRKKYVFRFQYYYICPMTIYISIYMYSGHQVYNPNAWELVQQLDLMFRYITFMKVVVVVVHSYFIIRKRQELLQLMNLFYGIYQQHKQRFRIAAHMQMLLFYLIALRSMLYVAVFFVWFYFIAGLLFVPFAIYFMPMTILTFVVAWAFLIILHLFQSFCKYVQRSFDGYFEIDWTFVLAYYGNIIKLHNYLKKYAAPILLHELLYELLILTLIIRYYYHDKLRHTEDLLFYAAACVLSCSYSLTISAVEQTIQDTQTTINNLISILSFKNNLSNRKMHSFCLEYLTLSRKYFSIWNYVYLRRSLVLEIIIFGWTNSILLSSIAITLGKYM